MNIKYYAHILSTFRYGAIYGDNICSLEKQFQKHQRNPNCTANTKKCIIRPHGVSLFSGSVLSLNLFLNQKIKRFSAARNFLLVLGHFLPFNFKKY